MFIARKKVEIIIESLKVPKIIKLVVAQGLSGYTIIEDVKGCGSHGCCDAEEVTDVFNNSYIIIVCTSEQAHKLTESLQPIIKKFGGICLISDVQKVQVTV